MLVGKNTYLVYIQAVGQVKVDPDALVMKATTKQPGLRWPIPIDARLDGLVGAANAAGAGTTRTELLAALVLSAPTGGATLRGAVVKLRVTTVRQAALGGKDPGKYVLRKRGRPISTRG